MGFGDFGVCNFVPFLCSAITGNADSLNPADSTTFISGRVQLLLSLVFVAIILIAVFVIVRAGVLYIQSQGDESKIEQAQKSIRNVFIGIAVMFIGIVGIVLVLAFFNAQSLLEGVDPNSGCQIQPDGTVDCTGGTVQQDGTGQLEEGN